MILSKLDAVLTKKLGADWNSLEIETISLEAGIVFDTLSLVKIAVIKSLKDHPDIILLDADYFLRFVEIANGNVPDPHHHDIPTSLELVWALHELRTILGSNSVEINACLSNVTRYVLNNEGHGEAYCKLLSMYSGYPLVRNAKTAAADEYISHMEGS